MEMITVWMYMLMLNKNYLLYRLQSYIDSQKILTTKVKLILFLDLDLIINKIKASNTKITQYVKGLKKGSNKNNIEESGKMIENNAKMITYL